MGLVALFLATGVAALFRMSSGFPIHLARLESRGRGDSFLTARGPWLAGVGLESRRAWIADTRTGQRWETGLDRPAMSVEIDEATGLLVVVPYVAERLWIFHPATGHGAWALVPTLGRTAVAAVLRGPDAWYVAWYNRNHDRSRQKTFPYLIPAQMRFEFGIAELPIITGGKNTRMKVIYQDLAVWHEETSHPWRLERGEDGALFLLNTLSEELIAVEADGTHRFRVPTPPGPFDLAVGGGSCFVASPASWKVAVFDSATGRTQPEIGMVEGIVDLQYEEPNLNAVSKYGRLFARARRDDDGQWRRGWQERVGVPSALAVSDGRVILADAVTGTLNEWGPTR